MTVPTLYMLMAVTGVKIGKLLHDFGCKESKDMYYQELANGVRHFKEEGGRRIMCEAVENYAKDYAEKYAKDYAEKYAKDYAERKRIDALYETVKNLMETMKLSAEQAMSAMKVSDKDRGILLKRL